VHERQQAAWWHDAVAIWKRVGASLLMLYLSTFIFAQSYVQSSSIRAGSRSSGGRREDSKIFRQRFGCRLILSIRYWDFTWRLGRESMLWNSIITKIGRRVAAMTPKPRSSMFIPQQLSVAVACDVTPGVLETFTNNYKRDVHSPHQSHWSDFNNNSVRYFNLHNMCAIKYRPNTIININK